jgi:hypothetical protein
MHDSRIVMASHRPVAEYCDRGGEPQHPLAARLIAQQCRGQFAPGVDTPTKRQHLVAPDEAPQRRLPNSGRSQLASGHNPR